MNINSTKGKLFLIIMFILISLIIQSIITIYLCYIDEGTYRGYSSFFNYLFTDAVNDLLESSVFSLTLSSFLFISMVGAFMIFEKFKKLKYRPSLHIIVSIITSIIVYPILIFSVFSLTGLLFNFIIK
jgi:hypothetical protein